MNEPGLLRKKLLESVLPEGGATPKEKGSLDAVKNLRDEFAMSALDHATSVYSKMTVTEIDRLMGRKNYSKDEAVARLAYNMADAMLAARDI